MAFACCTVCRPGSQDQESPGRDGGAGKPHRIGIASVKEGSGSKEPSNPKGRKRQDSLSTPMPLNIGLGLSASMGPGRLDAAAAFAVNSEGKGGASTEEVAPISAADGGELWSMPFRKARRRGGTGTKGWALLKEKRSAMVAMHRFLASQDSAERADTSTAISRKNPPVLSLVVVRGPCWRWGNEDGGINKPGTICGIDDEAGTVDVFWHDTERFVNGYQFDVRSDLCVAPEGLAQPLQGSRLPLAGGGKSSRKAARSSTMGAQADGSESVAKQKDKMTPAGLMFSTTDVIEEGDEDAAQSGRPSTRNSNVPSARARANGEGAAANGDGPLSPTAGSVRSGDTNGTGSPVLRRRDSQEGFDTPGQTIIIFDWDDTLFPTTYVRDDMGMSWREPVEKQNLPKDQKREIKESLERCENHAEKILQIASTLGKVIFLTLAKSPWVTLCCTNFYPRMGKLVNDLNVPIVYAQEGNQIDYQKQAMMSTDEAEAYWASMKGKAIAKEIHAFYSHYQGQSWKNILSIGDSDFERLGTFQAVEQYMKDRGLLNNSARDVLVNGKGSLGECVDSTGHVYHVRTKSLKIIDQPTPEEMELELRMVRRWLPQLVRLDGGCDFDLDALDSYASIQEIEDTLRGVSKSRTRTSSGSDESGGGAGAKGARAGAGGVSTPPSRPSSPKSSPRQSSHSSHPPSPSPRSSPRSGQSPKNLGRGR